jgi:hypothetical protein
MAKRYELNDSSWEMIEIQYSGSENGTSTTRRPTDALRQLLSSDYSGWTQSPCCT